MDRVHTGKKAPCFVVFVDAKQYDLLSLVSTFLAHCKGDSETIAPENHDHGRLRALMGDLDMVADDSDVTETLE